MGEVPAGTAEHQLVGVGGVVQLALNEVREVRGGRGDLGHDPLGHLVAEPALRLAVGRSAGRRRSCWRRASLRGRGVGSSSEGICRLKLGDAGTSPRTHPSKSCCICSAVPKNVTLRAQLGVVQRLVGRPVLGQPAQGEVGLEVGGAVVDGADAAGEGIRQAVGVEEMGERRRRIEVRHHDRSGRHLALAELDALHGATLDDDAGHLGVAAQLAPVLFEQRGPGDRRWCPGHLAPSTSSPSPAMPARRRGTGRSPGRRVPGRWS